MNNTKCIVDTSSSTEGISANPTSLLTTEFDTSSSTEGISSNPTSLRTTESYTSSSSALTTSQSLTPTSKTEPSTSTNKVTVVKLTTPATESEPSTSTNKVTTVKFSTPVTESALCPSNPCQYGGTCLKQGQDYECICVYGFSGKNCENCEEKCGNAKCDYDMNSGEAYCKCEKEQRFDIGKKTCKDLDECEQKFLNGECRGLYETCDKGNCSCEDNFSYNKNEICIADFCKNKRCKENEICQETSYGIATCACKDGFHLTHEGCLEIDKCTLMKPKCTQKCHNGSCSCEEGFELENDNYTCSKIPGTLECPNQNKCSPGKCHVLNGTEICVCPETTHISNNGTCTDKCTAEKIPQGMCPENKCKSDDKYGFVCICDGKYKRSENGIYCKRKNMCSEGGGNKECTKRKAYCREDQNDEKGFVCKCEKGFDFHQNTCTAVCDIKHVKDKCLQASGVCVLDENYKPSCKCPPLFEKDSSHNCVEKTKYSFLGNITIPKTIYGNNLKTIKIVENQKIPTFDHSKLTKDFVKSLEGVYGKNYKDVSILSCRDQKEDFTCSVELKFNEDPQETKTLNIITTPSVCIPLKKPQYCMVHPNFVMKQPKQAIFQKTDPCDDIVKNELCSSMTTCVKTDGLKFKADGEFFNCSCKSGYDSKRYDQPFKNENSFIHICEDRNECLLPYSCPENTSCLNTPGSFECFCEAGYRSTSNNIKKNGCIAVCDSSPCGVHGSCYQHDKHGYMCKCDHSYTGVHCETPNKKIKEIEENNFIVTLTVSIVLSSLIVISLIGVFILYKKTKKIGSRKSRNKHAMLKPIRILSKKVRLMWNPKYEGEDYSVAHQGISETFDNNKSNDDSERIQNADRIELQIKEESKCGDEILAKNDKKEEIEQSNLKMAGKTEEVFNLKL